jgi:hypothetical protein
MMYGFDDPVRVVQGFWVRRAAQALRKPFHNDVNPLPHSISQAEGEVSS